MELRKQLCHDLCQGYHFLYHPKVWELQDRVTTQLSLKLNWKQRIPDQEKPTSSPLSLLKLVMAT